MTMKVKAIEKKLKFSKDPNDPGVYRYVMSPEQYSSLNQKKVIKEAALRSGVSQGVMQACWDDLCCFVPKKFVAKNFVAKNFA